MKTWTEHKSLRVILAALLTLGTLPVGVAAQSTQQAGSKTLYQRLGGYDAIATFVDTAFPRVATDPKLARLFKGHSTDSKYRQRQLIIDILCRETGGPCVYIGRPMGPVHRGLAITEDDWTTFIKIISGAMEELKLSSAEKRELLDIFQQRFKPDVVEK
jgi:hemoglobin